MSDESETPEEEVRRHIKELWQSEAKTQAWLVATWALLETCLDLLKDDPRFPQALTAATNRRSSQFLNSLISERTNAEFMKILSNLTPADFRKYVQGQ